MVLMPQDADQIMPLANLGKELRPDYAIIKHCSDNEDGGLGIIMTIMKNTMTFKKRRETFR